MNSFKRNWFMKLKSSARWAFILLAALVCSCASPSKEVASNASQVPVDAGSFKVCAPAGKGWLTHVNREKDTVNFERPGTTITGGQTLSAILVFLNGVRADAGTQAEEQTADEFRASEEATLKKGADRGEYKLGPVRKGVTTVGEKKLYTMGYKLTQGHVFPNLGPATAVEAVLYLYFPPNFTTSRRFFSILINEAYARGAFASVDFSKVEPVIKSLELKPQAQSPK